MKYEDYSASDFAQDAYFQKWVLHQDEAVHIYWTKWLKEHPDQKKQVTEAIEMIRLLEMDKDIPLNQKFIQVWQEIYPKTIGKKKRQVRSRVAALWTGFFMVGMVTLYVLNQNGNKHYYSANDTSEVYVLPDGSTITLNKNSSLTYQMGKDGIREAWLDGEAFFDVKRWKPPGKSAYADFIIHTERAAIQVLGTSFNLREGRQKTQLVLHTGKVRLLPRYQEEVYVHPGEFVEINEDFSSLVKKSVDTRLYASWMENKAVFDQTPLTDIAQWIEDKYDKEVVLADPALGSVTFTATIPDVELDVLLEALALTYQVKIATQGDLIEIGQSP